MVCVLFKYKYNLIISPILHNIVGVIQQDEQTRTIYIFLKSENSNPWTNALNVVCDSKQKLKSARYRLEVVITELEKSPSNDYRVALLSFINCVILSSGCLQDQIRLRNEFIGTIL